MEDSNNQVFLSIASLWEITIKYSIRKLKLDGTIQELVEEYVERKGFTLLPILPRHLIELERLPYHHRDPFDRIIIAQSIVESLEVMTTDGDFDLYGIIRVQE